MFLLFTTQASILYLYNVSAPSMSFYLCSVEWGVIVIVLLLLLCVSVFAFCRQAAAA